MWTSFDFRRALYDCIYPSVTVSLDTLAEMLEDYGFGILDIEDAQRDSIAVCENGVFNLMCPWIDLIGTEWIVTATGKLFWPFNPRVRDIEIEDIARALSRIQRFGGHTNPGLAFFSVAEHSLAVLHDIRQRHKATLTPNLEMLALLHDGGETYVGDMMRPIKHRSGDLEQAERNIRGLILGKYGARIRSHEWDIVKESDTAALWSEIQYGLIPMHTMPPWQFGGSEPRAFQGPRPCGMDPELAYDSFLKSFHEIHARLLTSRGW